MAIISDMWIEIDSMMDAIDDMEKPTCTPDKKTECIKQIILCLDNMRTIMNNLD